jgi:hypothetical protein
MPAPAERQGNAGPAAAEAEIVVARGPPGEYPVIEAMDPLERALLDINTADILSALGWGDVPVLRRAVALAVRAPAAAFARRVRRFDREVLEAGVRRAAVTMLRSYVRRLDVRGAARIPARGPVLLLSNHPGMTDTLALFSAIPRADLRVLAADRPFLRALPAMSRSLITVSGQKEKRMQAVRQAVAHLRGGGALLTFPAGEIEPDPAVLPGAAQGLARWSPSTLLFLRFIPDCTVVPLVVSGVLSPQALRHPLTLLRRKGRDRERLGAMLQMVVHTLVPSLWPVDVSVDVLEPFAGSQVEGGEERALGLLRERVASFLDSRESA